VEGIGLVFNENACPGKLLRKLGAAVNYAGNFDSTIAGATHTRTGRGMAAPTPNSEAFRRLIAGVKSGYLLVFVASIVLNLLVLTSPVYMMQVYDRVLLTGSIDTLVFLTLLCALAMGVMGILDAIRSAMLARIGAWFERTLRFELLSGVLRVAFDRGNSFGQQLLGDLQTVKNYLGSNQVAPVFDAPWAPVFLLVIWVIHPWMGIFACVSAAALMAIALTTDFLTRKKMKEMQSDQIAFARFSQQVITNHDIVLGMGMTVCSRFSRHSWAVCQKASEWEWGFQLRDRHLPSCKPPIRCQHSPGEEVLSDSLRNASRWTNESDARRLRSAVPV
jgi:ABC-type protease/lipase transport system fused ATPase/permease subunit